MKDLCEIDPSLYAAISQDLSRLVLSRIWGRPESIFDLLEKNFSLPSGNALKNPRLIGLLSGLSRQVEEQHSVQAAHFLLRYYLQMDPTQREALQSSFHRAFNVRDREAALNPRVALYRLKLGIGELDIALGFAEDLEQTEAWTGSASYKWWEVIGIAKTVALENFDDTFPDVIDRSRRIYFNLEHFFSRNKDIAQALKRASAWTFSGWVNELKILNIVKKDRGKEPLPKYMPYATEIELGQILKNPKWLAKTTFMMGDRELSPAEVDEVLWSQLRSSSLGG